MFKTSYRRSHLIASVITASVLLTATGAVALTHEPSSGARSVSADAPLLGRFVVSREASEFIPATRTAAR
jgi:hypothetical protein